MNDQVVTHHGGISLRPEANVDPPDDLDPRPTQRMRGTDIRRTFSVVPGFDPVTSGVYFRDIRGDRTEVRYAELAVTWGCGLGMYSDIGVSVNLP